VLVFRQVRLRYDFTTSWSDSCSSGILSDQCSSGSLVRFAGDGPRRNSHRHFASWQKLGMKMAIDSASGVVKVRKRFAVIVGDLKYIHR
jgi:hypothetical protein